MSSDFALEKLQRAADGIPEESRTPELRLLLEFSRVSQESEERLAVVRERRAGGAAAQDLLALPETFQGLALFVRAVALGAEAAGVGLCSADTLTLLKESLLQPIVCREEDGSYQAHRASVVCPSPSPLNILQLLASGVFLHVTGNPEPAIAMLSAALSGVWPASREMQRRLVARQFVPSAEAAAAAGEKKAKEEEGKEEQQASAESGGGAGAGTSTDQAGSSQQAEAAAAAKVAKDAAEVEAGEADQEEGPTALASALGEALQEHCPGISVTDIHKAALVLRLFLGCRAVGEQGGDGPSLQAVVRMLLMDVQQLLDLDPSCHHAYVWAAQLLLYVRWPLDRRLVRGLFEEGLRRTREAQCWLAAGEVAHDFAMWVVLTTAGERNVAVKQAALLEAGTLLEVVKEAEEQLGPWMPAGRLHQLTARHQELGKMLQQLQKMGPRGTLGSPQLATGAPNACSFCGQQVPQLRLCGSCKAIGYCSRECQVKDWKAGHKAVCTGAGGAGSGDIAAGAGAGAAQPAATAPAAAGAAQ